jgi:hypothetical protein
MFDLQEHLGSVNENWLGKILRSIFEKPKIKKILQKKKSIAPPW